MKCCVSYALYKILRVFFLKTKNKLKISLKLGVPQHLQFPQIPQAVPHVDRGNRRGRAFARGNHPRPSGSFFRFKKCTLQKASFVTGFLSLCHMEPRADGQNLKPEENKNDWKTNNPEWREEQKIRISWVRVGERRGHVGEFQGLETYTNDLRSIKRRPEDFGGTLPMVEMEIHHDTSWAKVVSRCNHGAEVAHDL